MSGEVLYRKWRPPRFADIVGQNAVTQTLTQAVATGRTSHAYLLCGPRGTGKTSTARVLAKALNCTMRPEGVGDPCGACDACRAIEQGSYVDLIEIDAASNRGIDEMRDLREKVRFSPTQGKFKVYIIDEAHALTNDAFNAFLKTLEEPPPHSVFVLATTEAHRLPATIVSRCQRFDFHRIAPSDVVDRLAEIATAEGVDVSPEVLRTISRASGGSLRDATNLLDQLITSFGANVSIEQVQELLGMGGEDRALALVKHLLTNNTKAALELINTVTSEGQDIRPLHRMTVDFLRAALLMKSGVKDSLELSKEANAELSFAASNTTLDHLLRALRMFGQVTLKFDQPSPLPLELATVELSLEPAPVAAAAPQSAPAQQAPQYPPQQQAAARPPMPPQRDVPANAQPYDTSQQPRQQQPPAQRPAQQPVRADAPPPTAAPVFDPSAPIEERLIAQWPAILRGLSRVPKKRFDVAALLRSSSQHAIEGNDLVVRFTHTSNSERLQAELDNPQCRIEVEKVLSQALGEGITLRLEADDSRKSVARSSADQPGHLVRAAMSLGGQVIQNGVPVADQPAPAAPESSPADAPIEETAPPSSEAPAPTIADEVAEPAPASEEPPVAAVEPASPSDSAVPETTEPPVQPHVAEPGPSLAYEPITTNTPPASEPTPPEDEQPLPLADAAPEAVAPVVEQVVPPMTEPVVPIPDPVAELAPVEDVPAPSVEMPLAEAPEAEDPAATPDPVLEPIGPQSEPMFGDDAPALTYEPIPSIAEPTPDPAPIAEEITEIPQPNANEAPDMSSAAIEPATDQAPPPVGEPATAPFDAAPFDAAPFDAAPFDATPFGEEPPMPAESAPPEPTNTIAEPLSEAPVIETPLDVQDDVPKLPIDQSQANEPSMLDDLLQTNPEPEPVPAAAQPGPMFDFGGLTEPSPEESNNE